MLHHLEYDGTCSTVRRVVSQQCPETTKTNQVIGNLKIAQFETSTLTVCRKVGSLVNNPDIGHLSGKVVHIFIPNDK